MKRILSLALPFVLAFGFSAYVHAETTLSSAIRLRDDISPAQLTAQTDNWNPTGLKDASVIRFSTDASRDLTGLAGGYDGRLIILHNVGAQNLVLKDASGSSSAANRFALTGDVTLAADSVAALQYDGTTAVWRLVGGSGTVSVDHGGLAGLTDDDHTQYPLLAGRSGGQTLGGGTGSGDALTLNTTSNSTKGDFIFEGAFKMAVQNTRPSAYSHASGTGQYVYMRGQDAFATSGNSGGRLYYQVGNGDGAGVDGLFGVISAADTGEITLTHDGTDGTIATTAGDLILSPSTGFVGVGQTNPTNVLDALSTGTALLRCQSSSAGATGPVATFYHNSASPAAADNVTQFAFQAKDNGGTFRQIARIAIIFDDVTSTTMDSSMQFSTQDNVNAGNHGTNATLTSLGVWTDASLAAGKTFEGKMDDVLTKVKNLRIEKYRSSRVTGDKVAMAERHYSCTAEDFYAAFGLGKDPNAVDAEGNKSGGIAPKDAAFLALDCIQRLIEENEALKARVKALEDARP